MTPCLFNGKTITKNCVNGSFLSRGCLYDHVSEFLVISVSSRMDSVLCVGCSVFSQESNFPVSSSFVGDVLSIFRR